MYCILKSFYSKVDRNTLHRSIERKKISYYYTYIELISKSYSCISLHS